MVIRDYCVYILWGKDGLLYIGSSRDVYRRVIGHTRNIANIQEISVVESTEDNYVNLEQAMILEYLPILNSGVNLNQYRKNTDDVPDIYNLEKFSLEAFTERYRAEMDENSYTLYKGFTLYREYSYCGVKPRKCSKYCFKGFKVKYHCYTHNKKYLRQEVDKIIQNNP